MRRPNLKLNWSFDDDFVIAGANARIALAVMRCARRLAGGVADRFHDDIALEVMPALIQQPAALLRTLRSPKVMARLSAELADAELPDLLRDRGVQRMLGEALVSGAPAFKALFDSTERLLERFIASRPHPLDRNVDMLVSMLSLPAPAVRFLRLAAAFCHGTLQTGVFMFVETHARALKAVAVVGECSVQEADELFRLGTPLWCSGLFRFSQGSREATDLDDLFALSAIGQRLLGQPYADASAMASAVLQPMDTGSSEPFDWRHVQQPWQLMQTLLSNATRRAEVGINILIHGEPGTGKTEFVRQLVAQVGLQAFSIAHVDREGNEATRADRLAHLRLSRTFAGTREGAVLVVDEADDIFVGDHHHPLAALFRSREQSKAWMNDILERAPQPVVWISNRVHHMDPAYLRRFTYCLAFPRPPLTLRQSMVRSRLEALGCSAGMMEAIASLDHATPALIGAAARFVSLSEGSGLTPDAAAQTQVQGHLVTLGDHTPVRPRQTALRFDMRYVNVAGPMSADELVSWLKAEGRGTALFAGPPGTGKTQFAAELAQQLERKLVVKTASDILSKWYGESERNVATMFRDCDPQEELLFLDEGDVLLSDRGRSEQRVDRGVTAEFLRWLEQFEGIFVCATNHAGLLDPALIRRFTHRLTFLPLHAEQRRALFAELAMGDPKAPLSEAACMKLDTLDRLTPGDFANVRRRLRHAQPDEARWLSELEAEQVAKPGGGHRQIGFV